MNIQPTRFDLSEDITKLKEKEFINKNNGKNMYDHLYH